MEFYLEMWSTPDSHRKGSCYMYERLWLSYFSSLPLQIGSRSQFCTLRHGSSSTTTCCGSLLSLLWCCILIVKILSSKIVLGVVIGGDSVTKFKVSKFFQAKIWWSWKIPTIGQLSLTHPTLPGIEWKLLMKHVFPRHNVSSPSSYFLCHSPHPCSSSSSQGDILIVTRKIDANWYEGYHGDQKGIFPITYVELIAEGEIITYLSQWKFCLDVK